MYLYFNTFKIANMTMSVKSYWKYKDLGCHANVKKSKL